MESSKNRIRVNIYGEEYTVRSDGDIEYMKEVARFVDSQMRSIADKMPNKSPSRVAILAALNITDELFKQREGQRDFSEFEKRAGDIISLLDEKIPE
ncbi:MAG: cell division protein ZapA [Candidatus Zixiibacteriota bacterium]